MAALDEMARLRAENAGLRAQLHDYKHQPATDWGNCRRGCPPSYLNKNGYCSPACELGAPRGEFVTVVLAGKAVGVGGTR